MNRLEVVGQLWFPNSVEPVDLGSFDGLTMTRWPANQDPVDLGVSSQPEMKSPLILCAEPAPTVHFLNLSSTVPVNFDARTDRTAVAERTLQLHINPMTA